MAARVIMGHSKAMPNKKAGLIYQPGFLIQCADKVGNNLRH